MRSVIQKVCNLTIDIINRVCALRMKRHTWSNNMTAAYIFYTLTELYTQSNDYTHLANPNTKREVPRCGRVPSG